MDMAEVAVEADVVRAAGATGMVRVLAAIGAEREVIGDL